MKCVSIIVPVYNSENKIRRCINSITNQCYTNLDIVLVDDGSSDNSGAICDMLAKKDPRITVIHQENKGVSAARNMGLQTAKGYYVGFVDSDDYLGKQYIGTLVEEIEKTKSGLVIAGYTMLKGTEEIKHSFKEYTIENSTDMSKVFGELYKNYFINSVCNKLFVRSYICGEFDEKCLLGEDCLFVIQYLRKNKKIRIIDEVGYYYQMEQMGSLTNVYRKDIFAAVERVYRTVMEYAEKIGCTEFSYNAIQYIFMNDVSKCIKELFTAKIHKAERRNILKEISYNPNFREASSICRDTGLGQKVLFYLLRRKYFFVVDLLGIIKYRGGRG